MQQPVSPPDQSDTTGLPQSVDPAERVSLPVVRHGTVRRGQTAFLLLQQAGVSPLEVMRLLEAIRPVYNIRRVRVGQPYELTVTPDGQLQRFVYEVDAERRLEVERRDETFVGTLQDIAYTYKPRVIQGTIQGSLYEALAAQGATPKMAIDLIEIFSWEVDFHTDIRDGDAFRVLVEDRYRDDERVGYHRILMAELVHQQQTNRAVYYPPKAEDGAYYHPDGSALQRMFLRSPLQYTRISSHFSHSRLHPVLKQYRPHLGIDYAAPSGTPVRSVADGMVIQAGYHGASGNMVTIRHNHVYSTYYLHLSRFATGMQAGTRVTQGQVIGYVGSTGLSTGPHLDFRIAKNGTFLNPLRQQNLEAPPLSRRALPAFQAYVQRLRAALTELESTPPRATATLY